MGGFLRRSDPKIPRNQGVFKLELMVYHNFLCSQVPSSAEAPAAQCASFGVPHVFSQQNPQRFIPHHESFNHAESRRKLHIYFHH